jgi:peptidyl-prolyl cis-trans isomerase C
MANAVLKAGVAFVALMLAGPAVSEDTTHGETGHAEAPANSHAEADNGHATTDPAAEDHGAQMQGHEALQADAQASTPTGPASLSDVVATVGGKEITLGHMLVARAALPDEYQTIPDEQLWSGLLEQLIQQEVLAQSPGAHETPLVRLSMENERRSLMAAVVIRDVAEDAIREEKVLEIYQRDYVNKEMGKEYNASHILLETQEAAEAVLARVKSGEDFAEVARETSTGPSGPNGGALGWFSAGMMVQPFQTAVESLADGEITGPVETQFGFHVIKLNETRSLRAPLLEEVRGEISATLQREAVEERIDQLMERAEISRMPQTNIDPANLSNYDLLDQ